jgi:hypothetical protein
MACDRYHHQMMRDGSLLPLFGFFLPLLLRRFLLRCNLYLLVLRLGAVGHGQLRPSARRNPHERPPAD